AIGGKRTDVAAEARLEPPDRDQHRPRHAEAPLDRRERPGISPELRPAPRNHARRDMACLEAGQIVTEHLDAAVVPLDLGIVGDAAKRGLDGGLGHPIADRDLLEGSEPIAKTFGAPAAILGASGRRRKHDRHGGEDQDPQISPQSQGDTRKGPAPRALNAAGAAYVHIPGTCMASMTSTQAPGICRCGWFLPNILVAAAAVSACTIE